MFVASEITTTGIQFLWKENYNQKMYVLHVDIRAYKKKSSKKFNCQFQWRYAIKNNAQLGIYFLDSEAFNQVNKVELFPSQRNVGRMDILANEIRYF